MADAEHPTFIPMYTPTTLQDPREHKTRPKLDTIGHKVNSLLFEPSLSIRETWILPQTCVLCMTRNQEEDHGQEGEDTKREEREEELRKKLQPPDNQSGLDIRRVKTHRTIGPDRMTGNPAPEPNERTSDKSRAFDTLQRPDDRPSPEIRRHVNRAKTPNVRQVPDDRTLVSHRTSDACLCTVYRAEPMYPFALTYPFVALDYIYSSTSTI